MAKDKLPGFNPFLLLIIILSLIIGVLVYGHLPERVPTHWNIQGEVDGYSGRFFGAFGLPLMTLVIYILMILMPRIDPKRMNYTKFAGVYNVFIVILVLFLLSLYAVILLSAFGYGIDVGLIVRIGLGILFIVLGNYLSRVRHNYFFGIKTPWTLASETVWRKTHRLGGILFAAAGFLVLVSIFFDSEIGFVITIGSIIAAALISTAYSYFAYKAEES